MEEVKTIRPQGPKSMSHLWFPPRGLPRPTLNQVLSEPDLRKEFYQHEGTGDRLQYRRDWMQLMHHLDDQIDQRKKDHKRRLETEVALLRARQAHKRSEEVVSLQKEKPAWTYPEPMEYFERPRPGLLMEASNSFLKNDLLQGIFDTPEGKPAHWEYDIFGKWAPFATADSLAKDCRARPIDAKEKMYKERLERKLKEARELERLDALKKTDGRYKKKYLEEHASEFSCLKREKPAWTEQRVYTHEYFSQPNGTKPGDIYYETGIDKHITQSERAMSYKRDVIVGDPERTSFWKEPPGGTLKGKAARALRAKALLCPRGCSGLQEDLMRETVREEMRSVKSTPHLRKK